ncbi:MAG: hypothetical protein CMJ58_19605 [Planctomycetaceae bacterium]|nr:hypothetical protein [Planctomycetaceae bacterium]
MGLFWDLMQQSQISSHDERAGALEARVVRLERELHRTQTVLHEAIKRLEIVVGEDLNRDGQLG